MNTKFKKGQKVEVNWDRHGWLPGVFEFSHPSPETEEEFDRLYVKMDNGFPCHSPGYHPDCVRVAA